MYFKFLIFATFGLQLILAKPVEQEVPNAENNGLLELLKKPVKIAGEGVKTILDTSNYAIGKATNLSKDTVTAGEHIISEKLKLGDSGIKTLTDIGGHIIENTLGFFKKAGDIIMEPMQQPKIPILSPYLESLKIENGNSLLPRSNNYPSYQELPIVGDTLRTIQQNLPYSQPNQLSYETLLNFFQNYQSQLSKLNNQPQTPLIPNVQNQLPLMYNAQNQLPFMPNAQNQLPFLPNTQNQQSFTPSIQNQLPFMPNTQNQYPFISNALNQLPFVSNPQNQFPFMSNTQNQFPFIPNTQNQSPLTSSITQNQLPSTPNTQNQSPIIPNSQNQPL